MPTPDSLDATSKPRLAGFVRMQHDAARDRWVLQGPERVLLLDEIGKVIVERASGDVTVGEIVRTLAAEYDAPEEMILGDVLAVLRLLAEKNFLEVDDGQV